MTQNSDNISKPDRRCLCKTKKKLKNNLYLRIFTITKKQIRQRQQVQRHNCQTIVFDFQKTFTVKLFNYKYNLNMFDVNHAFSVEDG